MADGSVIVHAAVEISFTVKGKEHKERNLYEFNCWKGKECRGLEIKLDGFESTGDLVESDVSLLGNVTMTLQSPTNAVIRHGRANTFIVDTLKRRFTVGEEDPVAVLGQTVCEHDSFDNGDGAH